MDFFFKTTLGASNLHGQIINEQLPTAAKYIVGFRLLMGKTANREIKFYQHYPLIYD